MSDNEAPLLRDDRNGVSTLTLNRPKASNALSTEMLDALREALDDIAGDDGIRAVLLTHVGPVFSAGHDMKQIRANPGVEHHKALFAKSSGVMRAIVGLPKPVIAKVRGVATAAGAQLVATCDLAYAARSSRFATPGVHIGLFCSTPMVPMSRNISRKRLMEMLLTGDMIDAETAADWGLINRAVDDDELDAAVDEVLAKIVDKSGLTIAMGKEAYYKQIEMGLDDAYAVAGEVMARNMATRDAEEGIDAFLEKREPKWENR